MYDWGRYITFQDAAYLHETEGPGVLALITAGSPGEAVYKFTLDRSTLTRHSPVFANVLRGGTSHCRYFQTSDGTEVVEVSGDRVSDWKALIRAIYDPLYVYPNLAQEDLLITFPNFKDT